MNVIELKRRLRKLKQAEKEIRLRHSVDPNAQFVWSKFFGGDKPKYKYAELLTIDEHRYRELADEFLAFVYADALEGRYGAFYYDADLLLKLDLPIDADANAVKDRFRALAKKYHPDTGGDAAEFIELMRVYRTLSGR